MIGIIAETQYQSFMPAWQEADTHARLYGVQGNLNENAIEGFEEVAEGSVIGGPFPDISTKPYMLRAIYEWCTDSGFTPYARVAC